MYCKDLTVGAAINIGGPDTVKVARVRVAHNGMIVLTVQSETGLVTLPPLPALLEVKEVTK